MTAKKERISLFIQIKKRIITLVPVAFCRVEKRKKALYIAVLS